MADKIETYDCTSGSAQHCYGCYTMKECKQRYGDWVRKDDIRLRLVALRDGSIGNMLGGVDALIAELTDGER